jgi:hypothetical protein
MGATKSAMRAVVSAFKWVVGDELYHSVGEDPAEVAGEAERPIFAMPLWAFDQFIETPEGQAAPSLSDPCFRQLGLRRAEEKKEFMRALNGIQFRAGVTYTFSFWSISQFMDNIMWKIQGIIPGVSIDFDNFCGTPPVHIVMYELQKPLDGRKERRHLQSLKNYFFHLAFWSSERKPKPERLRELLPPDELCSGSFPSKAGLHTEAFFKKDGHLRRPGLQGAALRGQTDNSALSKGFSSFSGCFAGLQALRPRRVAAGCMP